MDYRDKIQAGQATAQTILELYQTIDRQHCVNQARAMEILRRRRERTLQAKNEALKLFENTD